MESLAYLYNAAAYESNEPMPQLRQFDTLGSVLPNSAWISIQSLLAAVLAISVAHSALAATTGVVSTSGNPLNLRSAPNGGVVGSIPDGSQIELTGRNQDGFLELTDGTWVATEWISTSPTTPNKSTPNKSTTTPSASASPTRPPTGAADRTVAYIATAGEPLNVRTAPGGQVVGTLPNGTRIELTGRDSQGYVERTNATWLDKRYVSVNQPSVQPAPAKAAPLASPQEPANQPSVQPTPVKSAPQTSPQASPQAASSQPAPAQVAANRTAQTVGYVRTTGNPLNVRNAPGGQVISTLPNGTRLELTGRENAGYLERSNGTWLDQRYVAYTPVSANQAASPLPSPSQTRAIQSPSPAVRPSPVAASSAPATAASNTPASNTPASTAGRSSATVRTSGDPLNVRSAPGGAIVGTVPNGSQVELTGRRSGEWAERSNGTWVASTWLTLNPATSPTTGSTPPQVQPPVNSTPVGSSVSAAVIRTNGSSLNVRSAPGGAVVGSVPNGSRVELTGRRSGEWAERSDGTWVSSTWVVSAPGTAPTSNSNPANSSNPNNSTSPVGSDVTSGTIRTNGNPLNVRSAPNGAVIGVVANGSRVELTGRNSGGWVQLGQGGWVSSDWIVR